MLNLLIAAALQPSPAAQDATGPLPAPLAEQLAPGATFALRGVQYSRTPSTLDFRYAYPARAYFAHVQGKAVLLCLAQADGSWKQCAVASESPAGWNFGQAALAMAVKFRIKPLTKDGRSVDGGSYKFTINFKQ